MSEQPSHEYTITLTEGTYDRIKTYMKQVEDAAQTVDVGVDSYEDLAHKLRDALDLALNLQRTLLGSVLRSTPHDGDVRVSVDGPQALFFRYASGYHGGMVQHEGGKRPTWSIHT